MDIIAIKARDRSIERLASFNICKWVLDED